MSPAVLGRSSAPPRNIPPANVKEGAGKRQKDAASGERVVGSDRRVRYIAPASKRYGHPWLGLPDVCEINSQVGAEPLVWHAQLLSD